jgi:hypothetical protein
MNTLEEAARSFVVSAKANRLLERNRSAVLLLRAREATFSQIHDLFAQHGVVVSESSITRFCRKHRAELQRLRLEQEQETDLSPGFLPTTVSIGPASPASSLIRGQKIRDLRGEV